MNRNLRFLCRGALIAALYVVLTWLCSLVGLDKGVIQMRLSEGRMYQCLCAAYTSEPYTLIPIEAELGRLNIEKRTPLFLRYVHRRKAIAEKQIAGKRKAGADAAAELALLDGYNGILEGEYEIT